MNTKKHRVCYLAHQYKEDITKVFDAQQREMLEQAKKTRLSIRDIATLFDIVLTKCSRILRIPESSSFFPAMKDHLVNIFQERFGFSPKELETS